MLSKTAPHRREALEFKSAEWSKSDALGMSKSVAKRNWFREQPVANAPGRRMGGRGTFHTAFQAQFVAFVALTGSRGGGGTFCKSFRNEDVVSTVVGGMERFVSFAHSETLLGHSRF